MCGNASGAPGRRHPPCRMSARGWSIFDQNPDPAMELSNLYKRLGLINPPEVPRQRISLSRENQMPGGERQLWS